MANPLTFGLGLAIAVPTPMSQIEAEVSTQPIVVECVVVGLTEIVCVVEECDDE